jgi:hypothetical protein
MIPLTITGLLIDGRELEGTDCIWILAKDDEPPVPPPGTVPGPAGVTLGPAVPNPFNPVTRISYYLPDEDFVELTVYDVRGDLVERLVACVESKGEHFVTWDAKGRASGTYFYKLRTGTFTETRKMLLIK